MLVRAKLPLSFGLMCGGTDVSPYANEFGGLDCWLLSVIGRSNYYSKYQSYVFSFDF